MQTSRLVVVLACILVLAGCQSAQPPGSLPPSETTSPALPSPTPIIVASAWHTWPAASQPKAVYAIAADGDDVWVGTSYGIWHLDPRSGSVTVDDSLGMTTQILRLDDGAAWAITSHGARYFDGHDWIAPDFDRSSMQYFGGVYAIGIDLNGDLWLQVGASRTTTFLRYAGHVPPDGPWPEKPDWEPPSWDRTDCEFWQAYVMSGYSHRSREECEALKRAIQSLGQESSYLAWLVVDADGDVWWWQGSDVIQVSGDQSSQVSLPVLQVYALAADPAGGVWAGTDQGLAHIDGSEIRWVSLGLDAYTLRSVPRNLAVDPYGNAWVLTEVGLQMLAADGDTWQVIAEAGVEGPAELPVSAFSIAPNGDLWLTHGWDLWRIHGGLLEFVSSPPGEIERCGEITQLLIDRDGDVWSLNLGCDLLQFIPTTGAWIRHQPDERIDKVSLGANGKIYAQGSTGLWLFDGIDWKRVLASDRLVYNSTFAADSEGQIWFHQWDTGEVSRYQNGQPSSFGTCCQPYWISGMYLDPQSRLWLASGTQLMVFDDATRQDIPVPLGDPVIEITSGPDGRIWLAGYGGIAVYDPARQTQP